MSIARILGLVCLIVGVVLLIFGIQATDAIGEKTVKKVMGRYSDTTVTYLVVGSALIVGGIALVVRKKF